MKLINKNLWDFIAYHTVQHLYKILFNGVRMEAHIKDLACRCDSPDVRRFMEMELSKVKNNKVQIKTRIIKQEHRNPIPSLRDLRDCTEKIIVICSFCKKIRIDESKWVEVEKTIKKLDLGEVWSLPQLSHGVCETCFSEWSLRFMIKVRLNYPK